MPKLAALACAPAAVITIDSPDFCLRVAAIVKAARPKLRTAARTAAKSLTSEYLQASGRALGHRAFLKSLTKESVL